MMTFSEKFRFCPACGSQAFVDNDFKSKRCCDCGFTYYDNAAAATAAFIRNDGGQLLVARRANSPARGTLDLPGGFADRDETAEEGVIREIREETGLTVSRPTYLFSLPNRYLYSGMTIHTLDMFFEAWVTGDVRPSAADDAAELFWLPLSQVRPADFGLESIRQGVIRYLERYFHRPKP